MGARLKLAVAVLVLTAVVLGHGPALRMFAWPLVDDQPSASAAVLCLQGDERGVEGDATLDEATGWCRSVPAGRILLLPPWPSRVVEMEVVPSFQQMVRRELTARGVDASAIVALPGKARDDWDKARRLGEWLEQNPGAEVMLLCNRFHSGRMRHVLDAVLGQTAAAHVRIRGMASSDYDPAYWWRSRQGVKDVMFGWLSLAFSWGHGRQPDPPPRWTAEEYQCLLARTFGRP
jgi:uncharacterized SAM-binding protein YcdF (DUF218 family)